MKMKKIYLTKAYDDGRTADEYFYLAEEQDECSEAIRKILIDRYFRSTEPDNNYVISSVYVCEDFDH